MNGSHVGRTVLVTGASSGLGEHFAVDLSRRGARVVLAARRADRLQALVERIRAEGREALAVEMDVTDETSVEAAFDAAEASYGLIDTVVANAGVNVEALATDLGMDQYDAIQAVNARGVFLTVRTAGRRLLTSGDPSRGRILILASMGGRNPLPYLVAYCASKAAAVMMGRAFAAEWNRFGLSVNVLCPGYIQTDINTAWFSSEEGAKMVAKLPRKRLMPAEGLDGFVAHLTSDAAAYTTGAVIQIDDGQKI